MGSVVRVVTAIARELRSSYLRAVVTARSQCMLWERGHPPGWAVALVCLSEPVSLRASVSRIQVRDEQGVSAELLGPPSTRAADCLEQGS